MPCVIRKVIGDFDRFENFAEIAGNEWQLPGQVESLEEWLRDHRRELDPAGRWVADIGFCARESASGGGPVLTLDLMRMCLEVNLEIWLSEYPGAA